MAKAQSKNLARKQRVVFSLKAPDAREVKLIGDFNQWNLATHPMKMDHTGVWKRIVMLSPGRYEYKFLVDGRWQNDPENKETCPNRFGTHNNVLVIS